LFFCRSVVVTAASLGLEPLRRRISALREREHELELIRDAPIPKGRFGPRRRPGYAQDTDYTFDPNRRRRLALALAATAAAALGIGTLVLALERANDYGSVRIYVEHGSERVAAPEVWLDGKLACRSNPCDVKARAGKHRFEARSGAFSGSATASVRRSFAEVVVIRLEAAPAP
jgi:hypothetical protein